MKRQPPAEVPDKQALSSSQILLKINYYGKPGTFHHVSMLDIIMGNTHLLFFNGKIVLVGLTAPGIVDMVSTPFSQHRDQMSGVEVHATILNNILDANAIQDVDRMDQMAFRGCLHFSPLLFPIHPIQREKGCAAVDAQPRD